MPNFGFSHVHFQITGRNRHPLGTSPFLTRKNCQGQSQCRTFPLKPWLFPSWKIGYHSESQFNLHRSKPNDLVGERRKNCFLPITKKWFNAFTEHLKRKLLLSGRSNFHQQQCYGMPCSYRYQQLAKLSRTVPLNSSISREGTPLEISVASLTNTSLTCFKKHFPVSHFSGRSWPSRAWIYAHTPNGRHPKHKTVKKPRFSEMPPVLKFTVLDINIWEPRCY